MIEKIDNAMQLAVLLACGICVYVRLFRTRSRLWVPLALFYTCHTLATGYWLLYLSFFGRTPQYSYISDPGWYAAALFLCVLLQMGEKKRPDLKNPIPWLAPLFSAAAFLFFIQWGDYLGNLVAAVVIGSLGWLAIHSLQRRGSDRIFAAACLLYYVLQYAIWISSCFWTDDTLANPYFWFDFLQTGNLIFLYRSWRKAVLA